jgi:lipopolysaccharide biosynthesis regulator YciM
MLESTKIQRRQSEIRQSLAELAGKETPSEDELRSMTDLDRQYQANETRLRAMVSDNHPDR